VVPVDYQNIAKVQKCPFEERAGKGYFSWEKLQEVQKI